MTWSSRLEARWRRRFDEVEPAPRQGAAQGACRLEVGSAVIIEDRSTDDVWSFMRRPENAALIQEEIKKAYSVPGTGPGIGEMLVYETERDGEPVAYVVTVSEESRGHSFSVRGEMKLPDGQTMVLGQHGSSPLLPAELALR